MTSTTLAPAPDPDRPPHCTCPLVPRTADEVCDTCWHGANAQLAAPASPPRLASADVVFAMHPPTGLVARQHPDGVWRFLNVPPADELLSSREIAQLADHYPAAS